jgi:hypothetical protein
MPFGECRHVTDLLEHVIEPNGIALDGARNLLAYQYHRSRTTVESYYFIKYGVTLDHPYMPCIVESKGYNHKNYYPIETLNCYITDEAKKYFFDN